MVSKIKKSKSKTNNLSKQFVDYFKEIGSLFYERDWEVTQIMYAVLIGEHVLLKGIPGTAKSALARKVFKGFKGAEIYENQFTRFQDDSYVFGPQILEEFKKGIIKHNVEGTLVTANFAFLDEFFNASEELLVSTLEVLNERTFTRPHQKESCPLVTAIMTTNQERETEKELRAVYDRILFRSEVQDVMQQSSRLKMYADFVTNRIDKVNPVFKFSDLLKLIEEFDKYRPPIDTGVYTIFDSLVTEFAGQTSVFVSPRRKNQMLKIILASAFLRGNEDVDFIDVKEIQYALIEGGNIRAKTEFNAVYKKVEETMEQSLYIQKMEKLYNETLKEQDEVRRYKLWVGLSRQAGELIEQFKKDTTLLLMVGMVEKCKEKYDAKVKNDKPSDEKLF